MARRRPKGTGSIFQRGRIWFIQYVDNGGERQRESSHSEDKEAAQRLLNKRLGEIATREDRDIAVQVTINDLVNLLLTITGSASCALWTKWSGRPTRMCGRRLEKS